MDEGAVKQKILMLEADIEKLRGVIREMVPIIDWASVHAGKDAGNKVLLRYIDTTSKLVRDVLNVTIPTGGR